jgi:hypothetical protein
VSKKATNNVTAASSGVNGTQLLDVIFSTPGPRGRTGLPVIFWGPPGCAKTSKIEAAARRHALHLETVILSIRDPSDVAGLPVVSPEGVFLEPPAWAKRSAAVKSGVVFLDELSSCSGTLQAAALRVVAEGVAGELAMPPGVRIIAAANPEEQAAGGWTLTAPLANRLIHLDAVMPSAQEWADWLVGDGAEDTTRPPAISTEAWGQVWARTRSAFGAFMRHMPQNLFKLPETEAERGRAWPSHRSWELAARGWAGAKALGAGDAVGLTLLAGAVGTGAATEAFEYMSKLDLPDPEEILAGKAQVPMNRTDKTYASLAAVCSVALLEHPDQAERLTRASEIAAEVADSHADVAAACLKPICATGKLETLLSNKKVGQRVSNAFLGKLLPIGTILKASRQGR